MNWTTEKPTQPGWYWYRETVMYKDENMGSPFPVIVWNDGVELFAHLLDWPAPVNVKDAKGEWAGPLKLPT